MKPKLILIDLDGTLLDDAKQVTPASLSALKRAAAGGAEVVVATGRFYGGVPRCLLELPFLRYFILMNGAKGYDRNRDKVLFQNEIEMKTAQAVFDLLMPMHMAVDCYQNDKGLMDRRYYDRLDHYIRDPESLRLIWPNRTSLDDFRAVVQAGGETVQKIQCFFPDLVLRPAVMELLAREFPQLELSVSMPANLEINQAGATKGEALLALCRELSIDPAETAAFGDGTNDLTMLRWAGTGVAMANAAPEVLAEADLVAPSNREDGVAQVLNGWFGI